jgi:hypothetical protein
MKKLAVVLALAGVLLLTGCADMLVEWQIDEQGNIASKLILEPDVFSTEEVNAGLNFAMLGLFPLTKYLQSDMTQKAFTFAPATTFTFGELRSKGIDVSFDGSMFVFKIPPFFDKVSSLEENDVVATIRVIFPREVDIANTTYVEGNTAIWKLTKGMLTKEMTLKALLK